jgi:hypothetical protein
MTTITLEVPDELATRLDPWRDRLPDLLSQALELLPGERPVSVVAPAMRYQVFEEMIDFLASGPTPEQIIAHKASAPVQERLAELLDKNREEGLTEAEEAELDAYELVNHVMILLKARARLTKS